MYDLFVLGQLMDQDMTGYQLRKALTTVVGPEQTVSYGVLYPLLERRNQAGDVTLTTMAGPRAKKQAGITSQGRRHFHDLVLEPVAVNKQTQLVFQIKCNFLHLLTVPEQRRMLQNFKQFSDLQLENLEMARSYLTDNPRMAPTDVADALQLNRLLQLRAQAQADWITARLTNLH